MKISSLSRFPLPPVVVFRAKSVCGQYKKVTINGFFSENHYFLLQHRVRHNSTCPVRFGVLQLLGLVESTNGVKYFLLKLSPLPLTLPPPPTSVYFVDCCFTGACKTGVTSCFVLIDQYVNGIVVLSIVWYHHHLWALNQLTIQDAVFIWTSLSCLISRPAPSSCCISFHHLPP